MIYEFFTSRNNLANVATFVGQAGRLFYDGATGVLKISDGVTPGGANVQLPVATTTLLGGIKAGPGANVSIDGTLTINTAGLPLSIGNIQIDNNVISATNTNADLILASNGTGNVELVGNIHFHTTANATGTPFFTASNDGQITILVPAADATAGAVKIIGSTTGDSEPPGIVGAMLHVTGNQGIPNRIYYDGNGDYVAWVGRRWNGNLVAQTQVLAGQDVLRINATAYNNGGMPNVAIAQIGLSSLENQTTTAQGSKIGFTVTPIGSSAASRVEVANVTVANGVWATKFTGPVTGNVIGNITSTLASIDTANIGNINVGASGTITTPRIVINDGGVRAISDGTAATIDFSKDSMILWYRPSGAGTVTLANYVAGATVRLHINIGPTSRDINYGVSSGINSSTGVASFNGSGAGSTDISDTTMQLVYTCYDGTAANTYVAVTTI
jgi:hypothetical protein